MFANCPKSPYKVFTLQRKHVNQTERERLDSVKMSSDALHGNWQLLIKQKISKQRKKTDLSRVSKMTSAFGELNIRVIFDTVRTS